MAHGDFKPSGDLLASVSVEHLASICNPIDDDPWAVNVNKELVFACVAEGEMLDSPVPSDDYANTRKHAARIAYLITHGWNDAISVDVGVPSLGCYINWIVTDGNHRLAAAILRKDSHIQCSISGCISYAEDLLNVSLS